MPRPSKTGVRGLYRDTDGRYRLDLRWRDPGTGEMRRHRERLPPRTPAAAAKERARRIYAAAIAGEFQPDREAPCRLSKMIDAYLEWAQENRPGSVAARRSHMKAIREHLGDPLLDDISPMHVERMKREYRAGGRAEATVNRALATLKHLARLAVQWGWMDREIARRIREVKLFKEPPGRVRYLSADEEKRLLEHLPPWLFPIALVALLSGMRLGEVIALREDDVDVDHRVVHVRKSKNGRARRIPMNDDLAFLLSWQLPRAVEGWLFVTARGVPYRNDRVSRDFGAAVTEAKIDDFHFHDTRHDFATRLRRSQVGIDVIAKLLGHRSLAMTQRYAHLDDPTLRGAVAAAQLRSNTVSASSGGG